MRDAADPQKGTPAYLEGAAEENRKGKPMMTLSGNETLPEYKPWIGVDLDGTLAEWNGWCGPGRIGPPVPAMLARVKKWLAEGKDVRIVSARFDPKNPHYLEHVVAMNEWMAIHIGESLLLTNSKDFHMVELWDDRAVQVEQNTGRRIDGVDEGGMP